VVFRSIRKGPSDLLIKPPNGATDEQQLLVSQQNKTPLDWSRDGRFQLFSVFDAKTQSDLWVLPMASSNGSADESKPFPIVQTRVIVVNDPTLCAAAGTVKLSEPRRCHACLILATLAL
jgi:hypothetical protein